MKLEKPEELKRSMATRTDQELYDILYIHPDDWTTEAHHAAQCEFASRALAAPNSDDAKEVREQARIRNETPLGWLERGLSFFFGGICAGIPGLLLFRYYLAQGQRRKAEDLRDWGFYGLGFYIAIGILFKVVLPMLA